MAEIEAQLQPKLQPRRSFAEEFKREAVRLAIERGNVSAVARDLRCVSIAVDGCRMRVMEQRYGLRDDQWERLEQLGLPGHSGHVGVTAKDNRLFVEAVLYRLRAGIPWRDLPPHFGNWHRVYVRFTCTCASIAGASRAYGTKYLSSWPKSQTTSTP